MAGVPAQRARITLAIAAMGGQGGGVLAEWIVAIAEQSGYFIQTTSVPGVAQRTGATIYYLELFPKTPGARPPILGLMPIPGDVDIVVAAELADYVELHTAEAFTNDGWFGLGEADARLQARIGDYVLLCRKRCIIKDVLAVEGPFSLIGVHGGASADEMYVPLITAYC